MIWLISIVPLFKTFNVHLLSSPTQVGAPISIKSSSLSPKIENQFLFNLIIHKLLCWPKIEVHFQFGYSYWCCWCYKSLQEQFKRLNMWFLLHYPKYILELHGASQKIIYLKKQCLSRSPPLSSNINHIWTS